MPVRVFLVDDDQLVRMSLRALINGAEDLALVGEADTATVALDRIPSAHPDVAVIDLRLGSADGIEVCRQVRSCCPGVNCLILSAYSDEKEVAAAIMAGAAGYVLKHRASDELLDAIRAVGHGETVLDPAVAAGVVASLRSGHERDPLVRRLSAQELRILKYIANGDTNRQIAEKLALSEKTVRNYVSNVLGKMGMHRRSQAAAYAARLDERGELGSPE